MSQREHNNVGSEPERFLAFHFRIVMSVLVGPAVTWIRLERVIDNKPSVVKKAERLRRLAIVLVTFRRAIRKLELQMVNRVVVWQLNHFLSWKHFFHLSPKRLVHSVIIVSIKKAAVLEVCPQSADFILVENDVAVPSNEDERIREEALAVDVDELISRVNVKAGVLFDEREKVDFGGWVVVPIATSGIFEAGNLERAGDAGRLSLANLTQQESS